MFDRGDVVTVKTLDCLGVVIEYDHENEAKGGVMNAWVRVFKDGKPFMLTWFMDDDLEIVK